MAETPYSKDETEILKQRRLFQDLVNTEAWKELEKIVERQIADNFNLLVTPFHKLANTELASFDALVARMESVKGAVNGMRYVMSLPLVTIDQGSDIIRAHNPEDTDAS